MDLIKIQDDKYEIYEDLIMQRDNLRKDADNYLAQYIHHFGDLITESFKAQVACISRKKAISYCQMIVNRGEIIDIKELDDYLKECMREYKKRLKSMVEDVENCRELKRSTQAAVNKSKALYRTIAKQIHPDINPEAAQNEVLYVSDLNEFTKNAEKTLCTADDSIKTLTVYINNIGNSVFSRQFPSKQIPELRIRIYKKDGMWELHFRDNGDRFDPTEQETFDGFNAKYIRSMNQNVLTLQQNNPTI